MEQFTLPRARRFFIVVLQKMKNGSTDHGTTVVGKSSAFFVFLFNLCASMFYGEEGLLCCLTNEN